jgi:hypothetical protein
MPSLNIVVSTIEEERTLNGSTKSTEKVISYVGGIDSNIVPPGQEMFLNNVGTFNDRSQIPLDVARKIEAQAARRMTTSSLARRASQRQGQGRRQEVYR